MQIYENANNFEFQKLKILPLLHWADNNFANVCFLNSNSDLVQTEKNKKQKKNFEWILAVGAEKELRATSKNNFERLKKFYEKQNSSPLGRSASGSVFGFLSYDLKNEIENLSSENSDGILMPLLHFFVPKHLFIFKNDKLKIFSSDNNFDVRKIIFQKTETRNEKRETISLKPRISKKQYIEKVNKIKQHIHRGDIYEMNFCMEFFSEKTEINPVETYLHLNEISPMPFSCFYKLRKKYLLCSSPERFLKKNGNKIISQPIKGTIRRGKNPEEDKKFIKKLSENKKEQSENVMIVDLVRNDLSRVAKRGTVKVDELFGIYSYKHLHQMISTVSCELDKKYHFVDALKNCFPMGSMTGAPKVRAMELIEKFENAKRGLFSGAVGYISPISNREGLGVRSKANFDFNVVIRSILYNAEKKYISVMAGSAITAECDAEKEYEECLLKAEPMIRALENQK